MEDKREQVLEVLHTEELERSWGAEGMEGEELEIPLSRLASLGVGFNSLAAAIQKLVQQEGGSGFYYVDAHGKQMFRANSGEGFIGSLARETGAVGGGQANMLPVAIDPAALCMAAALAGIDRKLDAIQEQQREIMDFLQLQEEAKIRGNIQTLADVMDNYRYNWENETYRVNKHILVQDIRRSAEQDILLYHDMLRKRLAKQGLIQSDQSIQDTTKKLRKNLQNYQLAVYQYAYAAFLEVLLLENHEAAYLAHTAEKIRDLAYRYRECYTDCYDHLKALAQRSVQTQMIRGLSAVSTGLGSVLAKTPVLNRGPVDERLIEAGQKLQRSTAEKTGKVMDGLIGSADSCTALFTENIDRLNRIWNTPKLTRIDQKGIRILEQAG